MLLRRCQFQDTVGDMLETVEKHCNGGFIVSRGEKQVLVKVVPADTMLHSITVGDLSAFLLRLARVEQSCHQSAFQAKRDQFGAQVPKSFQQPPFEQIQQKKKLSDLRANSTPI